MMLGPLEPAGDDTAMWISSEWSTIGPERLLNTVAFMGSASVDIGDSDRFVERSGGPNCCKHGAPAGIAV